MHQIKAAVIILAGTVLAACAHLDEVRDFAGESAKLSGYTAVVDHTLDAYSRSAPFLIGDVRDAEAREDKVRQASRESLLSLHKMAAQYMVTMAKLAGDEAFSADASIDKLANSIKAAPELGVSQPTADAYTKLFKTLTHWATSAAQEKAVKQMLNDGGADFQKVLSGMADVAGKLKKIHDNERETVLGTLGSMIDTTPDRAQNYLTVAIARDLLNRKKQEYRQGDAIYAEAAKGIQAIQDGHRLLLNNVERLDAKEVRARLKQFQADIKAVRESLTVIGK